MIVNGYRLEPIPANEARKLPEGTVLIVHRVWHDPATYQVTREAYYRARLKRKKTVMGLDAAVYSEPDCDFPELPPWQLGWIWLEEIAGMRGFMTIEGRA